MRLSTVILSYFIYTESHIALKKGVAPPLVTIRVKFLQDFLIIM